MHLYRPNGKSKFFPSAYHLPSFTSALDADPKTFGRVAEIWVVTPPGLDDWVSVSSVHAVGLQRMMQSDQHIWMCVSSSRIFCFFLEAAETWTER